jgi:NADH:ubiquinone oxidoreductase subunit F (NADH-binding)
VNADESEPGTCKDREIMRKDPHKLIEGCLLSGYAMRARAAYIYIRGEYFNEAVVLDEAIHEAYAAGLIGRNACGSGYDFDVYLHRGAGAYICGEETALIESLEGKTGQPRLKPPFPAVVGVFGCPTVVNNVESIACVPLVIERGAEWWAAQGSEKNGGPKIVQISGKVKRPGTYEVPNGISLRDVVFSDLYGGGPLDGRTIRGVIPGGTSCPVLRADQLDVKHDFDALKEKPFETMAGTSGVIVMDDTVCVVRIAARIARFYHHESCGQCTPCREGTGWVSKILDRIEAGGAKRAEVDQLLDIVNNIRGNTICPFGDAVGMSIGAYLRQFPDEFIAHVEQGRCTYPAW